MSSPSQNTTPAQFGAVFGFGHAMVDFATVSVAFAVGRIYGIPFIYGISVIILYDVIAFAGQAVIGFIVDRTRTYKALALTGIVLVASSVPLLSISPVAAVVCTAGGNARRTSSIAWSGSTSTSAPAPYHSE